MTEPDPHQWPEPTAATLLAALDATRKADQEERDRRHFGKGEG